MTSVSDTPFDERARRLRALHEEMARAELEEAERLSPGSDRVASRGAVSADVAVVKGLAGPAEAAGGAALSGPDGEAVVKALEALGWSADRVFFTLSRPESGADPVRRAARLRRQIEAVDAPVVLAVDAEAAKDVAAAFELSTLASGCEVVAAGRRLFAVDGLEASLADEKHKRAVWVQMRCVRPPGAVY